MSSNRIDLTGQRFGRLTAIEYSGRSSDGQAKWKCICDCGTIAFSSSGNLRSGRMKSCGCLRRENGVKHALSMTKHGQYKSRLHRIWNTMKNRCQNPNVHNYESYGGRGITVCDEWQRFEPFYEWAMSNGYRDHLTLDRKDNFAGYSPDNCRWATMKEQQNNKRIHQLKRMEETHGNDSDLG